MGIQYCGVFGRTYVFFFSCFGRLYNRHSKPSTTWRADTPPGEESRLTRALKAYHIDKARDPTDLPPWLFEEHERRPLGRSETSLRYREGREYDYDSRRAAGPPRPSGRGLRDIYDTAATDTAIPSRQQETRERSRGRPQEDIPVNAPSKANDRLKALRDAKRNAAQRNAGTRPSRPTDEEWPVRRARRKARTRSSRRRRGPTASFTVIAD
jgi:hypothetical protein